MPYREYFIFCAKRQHGTGFTFLMFTQPSPLPPPPPLKEKRERQIFAHDSCKNNISTETRKEKKKIPSLASVVPESFLKTNFTDNLSRATMRERNNLHKNANLREYESILITQMPFHTLTFKYIKKAKNLCARGKSY
jgi:hypothetical protein